MLLRVNDNVQVVPIDQRNFRASVAVAPGLNSITAVVTGTDGREAEDSITVDYVPKPVPRGVTLSSPVDGVVLGRDDPPAVVVDGRVEDPAVKTVWLVANEQGEAVPVRDGRFRRVVPVMGPAVRLWAESRPLDGAPQRSEVVTVRAPNRGPVGLVLLDWIDAAPSGQVEVQATRRDAPDRLDDPAVAVWLRPFPGAPGGGAPEAVYFRSLKPGVYTFTVRLIGPASGTRVRPTIYTSGNGAANERALEAVPVNGSGRTVVARILLPHGILWDDDGWTGKSESVDTITKFRVPEGITWVERKVDLP